VPFYDYRCNVCKNEFELFARKAGSVLDMPECPRCRTSGAKRLLGRGVKYSFGVGHFFEPYVDTDIHPNGEPIKLESQQQFFNACQKHGRGYRKVRDKLR